MKTELLTQVHGGDRVAPWQLHVGRSAFQHLDHMPTAPERRCYAMLPAQSAPPHCTRRRLTACTAGAAARRHRASWCWRPPTTPGRSTRRCVGGARGGWRVGHRWVLVGLRLVCIDTAMRSSPLDQPLQAQQPNLPHSLTSCLDAPLPSLLRRLEKRIYIGLPDFDERVALLKLKLKARQGTAQLRAGVAAAPGRASPPACD